MKFQQILKNRSETETLSQMQQRIGSFAADSLPHSGEFHTNPSVEAKVYGDSRLKPFLGDTTVFLLQPEQKEFVKKIQDKVHGAAGEMLAEPLLKETFHMTLHGLVDGAPCEEIRERMIWSEKAAREMLEQIRQEFTEPIHMRTTYLYNMNSTSVVLGLEPASEEDCRLLELLYECFQTLVPYGHRLTPHITVAYYRPGCWGEDIVKELRQVMEEVSAGEKLEISFGAEDLVYRQFSDMNHYMEKAEQIL